MKNIQLESRHHIIVKEILNKFNVTAYVFGSRAKNTAKTLSDLDLCLKDDYDKSIIRKLQDAFEESDLPFKVDVIVWSEISESFKKHIGKDLVSFNKNIEHASGQAKWLDSKEIIFLKEQIPLTIISTGPETFVAEVQISVDGQIKPFLLDTGAASSTIIEDEQTKNYTTLKEVESKGASGIATVAHIIQFQKISMGEYFFKKSQLKRTDRSILGIDLIGEQIFEVDLKNKWLNILTEFPDKDLSYSVQMLASKHFTIPLSLGKANVNVLFDTGADTTVIDSEYIKNNVELFELVRSEDGFDAHGNKIPSKVYKVAQIEIGTLKLQNVEMATFDFGEHLREKMEGSPIILGNNVIAKASWIFDLQLGRWSLRPYLN